MPSLPELQGAFASALTDAGRAAGMTASFRGSPERALARLAIYRGNVYGNCAKALASAYPIVRKIVGEEFFDAMARAYSRAIPSLCGDLNRYGERMPAFLGDFPPVADLPYLPDVARMEWLAHRAHFAPDAIAFDPRPLAGIPPERYLCLRARLAAPCALLESEWPLARIWTIHQDDYAGAFKVDLERHPDRILVRRPRWRAQVESLLPGDFRFLGAIARGDTLGVALEEALTADPRFQPSSALTRWAHARVIVGLE